MSEEYGVIILIPAHNESKYIKKTILSIPNQIDLVLLINDGSTDSTIEIARDAFNESKRIDFQNNESESKFIILDQDNLGVGSAVCNGLKHILKLEVNSKLSSNFPNKKDWFVVIMDADGQMDPADLPQLIEPLKLNLADHVKGNRIGLIGMPISRKIGSFLLRLLMRLASGYPQINDTQCGYRAIKLDMLKQWDFSNVWTGFGYTNWWLLESGRRSFRLKEVPTKSIYHDKKSKLKIRTFLPSVSILIFRKLWRRGWDWYILGKGSDSIALRFIISSLWFSSILFLFSITILPKYWLILLTTSAIKLSVIRILDVKETERRMKQTKSAIIHP